MNDLAERREKARRSLAIALSYARGYLKSSRDATRSRAEQFRDLSNAGTWRTYASIWPAELRNLQEIAS